MPRQFPRGASASDLPITPRSNHRLSPLADGLVRRASRRRLAADAAALAAAQPEAADAPLRRHRRAQRCPAAKRPLARRHYARASPVFAHKPLRCSVVCTHLLHHLRAFLRPPFQPVAAPVQSPAHPHHVQCSKPPAASTPFIGAVRTSPVKLAARKGPVLFYTLSSSRDACTFAMYFSCELDAARLAEIALLVKLKAFNMENSLRRERLPCCGPTPLLVDE
eukprot:4641049-Pleurochrysis_carterae.AAC.1